MVELSYWFLEVCSHFSSCKKPMMEYMINDRERGEVVLTVTIDSVEFLRIFLNDLNQELLKLNS